MANKVMFILEYYREEELVRTERFENIKKLSFFRKKYLGSYSKTIRKEKKIKTKIIKPKIS